MKKRNTKYLQMAAYVMLLIIAVIAIGIARDCSRLPSTGREGYSGGDTIDIALIYGPGSYYWYEDTLGGINHKIIDYFSEECSVPVKIWPVAEPAEALRKTEEGAFDILASLPLDNKLKSNFPVSESIFLDRLVLLQLNDSSGIRKVKSSLDLNGKKVYVVAGSSALKRLQNLSEEIGGKIEIEECPELSDELLGIQVATGEIPLAIVNERVAQHLARQYPDLSYDSSVSFTQFQVWIFNPADSLLLDKFNLWFDNFRTSETYRTLISSYS